MESGEIEAEMEKMKLGIHDLKEEIDRLRSRLNEIEETLNADPPIRIKFIKGKKGGVVAKVMKTGHVVLFNDEPSEDEIGNTAWMTDYDLRESKRTGNEYYKCFDYGEEKRKETEELEAEKEVVEEELDKKKKLRWYLSSQRDDLKDRYKHAKIEEMFSEVGMDADQIGKIYEMTEIGLTNALSQFNGSFDRVMAGYNKEGWRRTVLYITMVKDDVIIRIGGTKRHHRYLDNPPVDFYTNILYDSEGKDESEEENERINIKKYKRSKKNE